VTDWSLVNAQKCEMGGFIPNALCPGHFIIILDFIPPQVDEGNFKK
jgi:hypothetical protein